MLITLVFKFYKIQLLHKFQKLPNILSQKNTLKAKQHRVHHFTEPDNVPGRTWKIYFEIKHQIK